jgi:hypothetical protein
VGFELTALVVIGTDCIGSFLAYCQNCLYQGDNYTLKNIALILFKDCQTQGK